MAQSSGTLSGVGAQLHSFSGDSAAPITMTDWQAKVDFMRTNGVTSATWTDGVMTSCTLGPVQTTATEQSDIDPSDHAKREAQLRARTFASAGGQLIPRGRL